MATVATGNTDWHQNGAWAAYNNVWNPGTYVNGTDFQQTISTDPAGFPGSTVMSWSWPYDPERPLAYEYYPVRSYPMLAAGLNPWNGTESTTPDFPIRLGEIKDLDVSYSLGIGGQENLYNVSFSFWVGRTPAAGQENLVDEVMVWVHTGYWPPGGDVLGRFEDANGGGTIWSQGFRSWEYTALEYDDDHFSGTIDVDAILRDLTVRGILDESHYLLNIELGAEVTGGTGSLEVQRLSYSLVAGAAEPGNGSPPGNTPPSNIPPSGGVLFEGYVDGAPVTAMAQAYQGPVSYLQWQYLGDSHNEVVGGSAGNDFLNLFAGTDAANGGGGDDVLDGGSGSNWLTGGAGRDTFFVDGRNPEPTWSTITDLERGEWTTLWGYQEGLSRLTWEEMAGAEGYKGATVRCDIDGNGTIDASVTFTGMASGAITFATGRVDGNPYAAFVAL